MLLTSSPNTHPAGSSGAGAAGSGGGHPGRGVCGVRVGHDPQVSGKEQSGRRGIWSGLPLLALTSAFSKKEPAGVSQPGRESSVPAWHGCSCPQRSHGREGRSVLTRPRRRPVSARGARRDHHGFYSRSFLFSSTLAKVPRELKVL